MVSRVVLGSLFLLLAATVLAACGRGATAQGGRAVRGAASLVVKDMAGFSAATTAFSSLAHAASRDFVALKAAAAAAVVDSAAVTADTSAPDGAGAGACARDAGFVAGDVDRATADDTALQRNLSALQAVAARLAVRASTLQGDFASLTALHRSEPGVALPRDTPSAPVVASAEAAALRDDGDGVQASEAVGTTAAYDLAIVQPIVASAQQACATIAAGTTGP